MMDVFALVMVVPFLLAAGILIMPRKKAEPPPPIPVAEPVPDRTPEILAAVAELREENAKHLNGVFEAITGRLTDMELRLTNQVERTREENARHIAALHDAVMTRIGDACQQVKEGLQVCVKELADILIKQANSDDSKNLATLAVLTAIRDDLGAIQEDVKDHNKDASIRFDLLADLLKEPMRLKISLPEGMKVSKK